MTYILNSSDLIIVHHFLYYGYYYPRDGIFKYRYVNEPMHLDIDNVTPPTYIKEDIECSVKIRLFC